jgi:hypothetical protein
MPKISPSARKRHKRPPARKRGQTQHDFIVWTHGVGHNLPVSVWDTLRLLAELVDIDPDDPRDTGVVRHYSRAKLATLRRVTERNFIKHTSTLENAGLLLVKDDYTTSGRNRANIYFLDPDTHLDADMGVAADRDDAGDRGVGGDRVRVSVATQQQREREQRTTTSKSTSRKSPKEDRSRAVRPAGTPPAKRRGDPPASSKQHSLPETRGEGVGGDTHASNGREAMTPEYKTELLQWGGYGRKER